MSKSVTKLRFREIHPDQWDRARLQRLIAEFKGRRILVIGDVGVDRYTIGAVERISPEAPVPIVRVEEEQLKLGLAANVADNVRTLGGQPLLIGVIGRDRCAQDFKALLRKNRIPANHLVVDGARRTALKERVVSDRQQLLRIDYESLHDLSRDASARILKQARALVRAADAVIIEDYAKGMLGRELMGSIFAAARASRTLVTVDPNQKTPIEHYRGAWMLTPNTREAEKLSGIAIRDQASLAACGQRCLRASAAEHVVITRGKEGMAIFSRTGPALLIPTYVREVYDVSGAGDTVIAVMSLALSVGASVEEAAVLGNLAAGVEVGKRGTATVTPVELRGALEFHGGA